MRQEVVNALVKVGTTVGIGIAANHHWYGILAFSIALLYVTVEAEK